MLLTSAQVSVAVSSGVVFFFTTALFLSGYAIQQRTLRDLRAAIKGPPRPSPKIFLPDRFRQSTTELPDGTIIVLDGDDGGITEQKEPVLVEVMPTPPGHGTGPNSVSDEQPTGPGDDDLNLNADSSSPDADEDRSKRRGEGSEEQDEPENPQKPISRAERRRRIKEEIMKLSQGQERGYYQRRLW
ncbi:hypothetical protein VTK56DRAFT_2136 [Thermocarpiscus australiensis]